MKAKTIILFNHKGGVSKTLTTFNIAWMLTLKGKRVLLADCDPQCNLTALLLGNQFDDYNGCPAYRRSLPWSLQWCTGCCELPHGHSDNPKHHPC